MNRNNVPDSSLSSSHQHRLEPDWETQVEQMIWAADAPIVLVSEIRKTSRQIFPDLQSDPEISSYAVLDIKESTRLMPALRKSVAALFCSLSPEMLGTNNPEDWSLVLRSLKDKYFEKSGAKILIIENFNRVLAASVHDKNLFATLLCHISCDCGVSVVIPVSSNETDSIAQLNGFEFLSPIKSQGVAAIPSTWSPPEMIQKQDAPVKISNRCVKSYALLSSAVAVAAAMLVVSIWVSQQLDVNLTISSPPIDQLRSGKVKAVSVAAAKTPVPASQESQFDPIPVALVDEPMVPGEYLEKGDETMPGIPDFAQNLTEDMYLKNLLTMEDFPYESIVKAEEMEAKIQPSEIVVDTVGNIPDTIKPLKTIKLEPEEAYPAIFPGNSEKSQTKNTPRSSQLSRDQPKAKRKVDAKGRQQRAKSVFRKKPTVPTNVGPVSQLEKSPDASDTGNE